MRQALKAVEQIPAYERIRPVTGHAFCPLIGRLLMCPMYDSLNASLRLTLCVPRIWSWQCAYCKHVHCAGTGTSDWKQYAIKHAAKVKSRVRKGIPDRLRGVAWQLLSGGRDLLLQNEGAPFQLVPHSLQWNCFKILLLQITCMDMKSHACISGNCRALLTGPSAIRLAPADSALAELARKSGKASASAI